MSTGAAGRRDFEVLSRHQTDEGITERHEISIRVPEDLVYLRGHFEGFPILAAVVILNNLVVVEAKRAWPDLTKVVSLSRLKFKRPIYARETISLTLARKRGESSITFQASVAERECNSGTLNFEASA